MADLITRADVASLTAGDTADELAFAVWASWIIPGHDADYLRRLLRLPPPISIQLPVYAYSTDTTHAKELADAAGVSYLSGDGALDVVKKIIYAGMDRAGIELPSE